MGDKKQGTRQQPPRIGTEAKRHKRKKGSDVFVTLPAIKRHLKREQIMRSTPAARKRIQKYIESTIDDLVEAMCIVVGDKKVRLQENTVRRADEAIRDRRMHSDFGSIILDETRFKRASSATPVKTGKKRKEPEASPTEEEKEKEEDDDEKKKVTEKEKEKPKRPPSKRPKRTQKASGRKKKPPQQKGNESKAGTEGKEEIEGKEEEKSTKKSGKTTNKGKGDKKDKVEKVKKGKEGKKKAPPQTNMNGAEEEEDTVKEAKHSTERKSEQSEDETTASAASQTGDKDASPEKGGEEEDAPPPTARVTKPAIRKKTDPKDKGSPVGKGKGVPKEVVEKKLTVVTRTKKTTGKKPVAVEEEDTPTSPVRDNKASRGGEDETDTPRSPVFRSSQDDDDTPAPEPHTPLTSQEERNRKIEEDNPPNQSALRDVFSQMD